MRIILGETYRFLKKQNRMSRAPDVSPAPSLHIRWDISCLSQKRIFRPSTCLEKALEKRGEHYTTVKEIG